MNCIKIEGKFLISNLPASAQDEDEGRNWTASLTIPNGGKGINISGIGHNPEEAINSLSKRIRDIKVEEMVLYLPL